MSNFYNNWNWIAWEKATFAAFLCSTGFMVFFSIDAVDHWIFPWNQISITASCLIPMFMVVTQHGPRWVRERSVRKEFIFIALLIIFGILNIFFGEELIPNFKGMGLFLLPAIGAFTASFFIFNSFDKISYYFWFYGGMLLWICLYGIWQYKTVGFSIRPCLDCGFDYVYHALFTSNPILAGATLLCLFAGPILLFISSHSQAEKICLAAILSLGVIVIILLGQRAAMFSIPIMVFFFGLFLNKRYAYLIFVLVVVFVLGYVFFDHLPPFIQAKINAIVRVPIYRLELYHFALHIFKESPLVGIGIWTPLEKYLWNYDNWALITSPGDFHIFNWLIQTNTSFHNMILYLFVHAGSFFAIAYIFFIILILGNLIKKCMEFPARKKLTIFYFTWLVGLLIPALSVDLLMYPDINFLFHSMLGLAPNLHLWVPSETQ